MERVGSRALADMRLLLDAMRDPGGDEAGLAPQPVLPRVCLPLNGQPR